MINREVAKNKVLSFLNTVYSDLEMLIIDGKTIENSILFVFFYNSKKYLLDKEESYALAGNGGIIVDKKDGFMFSTGTLKSIECYINEYKNNRDSFERIDI